VVRNGWGNYIGGPQRYEDVAQNDERSRQYTREKEADYAIHNLIQKVIQGGSAKRRAG